MIVGAVVLAAGKSERMGRKKLLLNLNGKTLIVSILDALNNASIDEQVVVVGHKSEEILEAVESKLETIKIAVNTDYEQGMISSFQKGLELLTSVDSTFLVLGDEPIVDSDFLYLMIQEMENNQNKALIISPIYKGKKGHPLLFHRKLFEEIQKLRAPQTLRDVIHIYADRMIVVDAPEWTIMDIDTSEDYARISALIKLR